MQPALVRKVESLNMNTIGVFFQSPASRLSGTREKVPFRAEVWAYSLTREPDKGTQARPVENHRIEVEQDGRPGGGTFPNVVEHIGEHVRREGLLFWLWGRPRLPVRECIGQERV